ncbi:MAG: CmcI family methyltransferase [Gammaproteobacteria bacterium]|nr:CmcI family methyltransferase [Gammaproteobacteria bacterium]MDJ0890221.1 CmcI family methyltransferase [Gammaproteobacteria bacterium]
MPPVTVNAILREASKHLAEGRLAECYRLSHELLARQPGQPDALFMLALVAFYTGNDVEMKECMDHLTARSPGDAHHHRFLGEYHMLCDAQKKAAESFKRALEASPGLSDVHRQLGQALRGAGDLDGAGRHLREFLKAHGEDAVALAELGWVELDRGSPGAALECFNQVLARDGSQAGAICGAGYAEAELGHLERAISLLKRARDLSPLDPMPCKKLGDLLHAGGELDEAIPLYQDYLERKHNLTALASRYRTDKWGSHFHTPHYQRHFSKRREDPLNILEIGVGGYAHPKHGGASLRMWKAYFPNAHVYSIDIHDKTAIQEERITIFQGSQNDPAFLRQVAGKMGRIDIVIDDGSHINEHVLTSFKTLFPLLDNAGIYVVEDTQTAYWPEYGGSSTDMNHPGSALTFFKSLTDGLNHAELLIPNFKPDYFQRHIVSMSFYHNLVFIQKGVNDEPSNREQVRQAEQGTG